MKVFRTMEDGFLLVVILNGAKGSVFLLDLWKIGIRDFQQFKGGLQGIKRRLGMNSLQFHQIDMEDGLTLIKQGYEISKRLGQQLPAKLVTWLEQNDIDTVPYNGSLYKCFNCEEGDLPPEEVDKILKIAQREADMNVIGTEEEEQYFYICETCKGDMHKAHETLED